MFDFRLYLQQELVRRCKANPQYSLRAFARALGVESSRLSKMLKAQRPIRKPMIEKLGMRLGLSLEQIQEFVAQSRADRGLSILGDAASPTDGAPVATAERAYRQLSLDAFILISDWRHYAILELLKVRGFKPDPRWIARTLGATVTEIRACLERLERVRILRVGERGEWIDESQGFSTHVLGETFSSHAHRLAQEEILKQAIHALQTLPLTERDQSSMMMATSHERLAEAKLRIKKFRRELCEFLEEAPAKDSVFQLSISLFPIVRTDG